MSEPRIRIGAESATGSIALLDGKTYRVIARVAVGNRDLALEIQRAVNSHDALREATGSLCALLERRWQGEKITREALRHAVRNARAAMAEG